MAAEVEMLVLGMATRAEGVELREGETAEAVKFSRYGHRYGTISL